MTPEVDVCRFWRLKLRLLTWIGVTEHHEDQEKHHKRRKAHHESLILQPALLTTLLVYYENTQLGVAQRNRAKLPGKGDGGRDYFSEPLRVKAFYAEWCKPETGQAVKLDLQNPPEEQLMTFMEADDNRKVIAQHHSSFTLQALYASTVEIKQKKP